MGRHHRRSVPATPFGVNGEAAGHGMYSSDLPWGFVRAGGPSRTGLSPPSPPDSATIPPNRPADLRAGPGCPFGAHWLGSPSALAIKCGSCHRNLVTVLARDLRAANAAFGNNVATAPTSCSQRTVGGIRLRVLLRHLQPARERDRGGSRCCSWEWSNRIREEFCGRSLIIARGGTSTPCTLGGHRHRFSSSGMGCSLCLPHHLA